MPPWRLLRLLLLSLSEGECGGGGAPYADRSMMAPYLGGLLARSLPACACECEWYGGGGAGAWGCECGCEGLSSVAVVVVVSAREEVGETCGFDMVVVVEAVVVGLRKRKGMISTSFWGRDDGGW